MGWVLGVALLVLLLTVCAADTHCTWATFRDSKDDCTHLTIGSNASGSIPPEIRDMSALSYLTLENTGLTGTIPADLFDGTLQDTLIFLNIANNAFIMGPIPNSMSSLSALRSLDISNTPIQGTIPRSFGNCNSLTRWSIDTVPLTGMCLLSCVYNISMLSFKNMLPIRYPGTVPPSFGSLFTLDSWKVNNTGLSGNLPSSIWQLNLRQLSLSNTKVNGTIPDLHPLKNTHGFTGLTSLDLSHNKLSG